VRYNERIRMAGNLIDDGAGRLLREVLDISADLAASFFEVTTAAMFLAFAAVPADACVIEVGLGGRFDATNVLDHPAACGIATLGIDHEPSCSARRRGYPPIPCPHRLREGGIAKPGVPLVTQAYPPVAQREIARGGELTGCALFMRGRPGRRMQRWTARLSRLLRPADLPLPTLPGAHQADNAALAVAMLRHQDIVAVSPEAMALRAFLPRAGPPGCNGWARDR
jgi:dihydrofolate synthase/folylpolyglutamate synthase